MAILGDVSDCEANRTSISHGFTASQAVTSVPPLERLLIKQPFAVDRQVAVVDFESVERQAGDI
jgi:hypothetical protein